MFITIKLFKYTIISTYKFYMASYPFSPYFLQHFLILYPLNKIYGIFLKTIKFSNCSWNTHPSNPGKKVSTLFVREIPFQIVSCIPNKAGFDSKFWVQEWTAMLGWKPDVIGRYQGASWEQLISSQQFNWRFLAKVIKTSNAFHHCNSNKCCRIPRLFDLKCSVLGC